MKLPEAFNPGPAHLRSKTSSRNDRSLRLKLIIALSVLMTSVLPSAACRRGGEPGTLVVAIEAPPRGFDPRFSAGNGISARIMQLVYDTLVVKNDNFEFVPSLASFDPPTDFKTFTFHLRPDVKFHNGKPLTSADVKYTFETLVSPALKSPLRAGFDRITSVDTPDPLTAVFHTSEPFYTLIDNLPAIGIIPEGAGPDIINNPVGSGPYKFISYSEGQPLKLEANADYWGGAPKIPRVNVTVVGDNSTRQAELMSGETDLAYNAQFDPETIRALGNRSDINVHISDGTNIDYLGLNLSKDSLLANQKLRQAVAFALDREVIIHRLLRDQARKADAILPPRHWAYESEIPVYNFDPERAKQLLDEAGFKDPDGDGPQTRLEINLLTTTNQLSRNIGAILQDQLRRVGIGLTLDSLEFATMMDRITKGQFDLYYLRSIGANQSTDVFQFVYHSRYQNPEFTSAITALRATTDPAQMKPLFDKLDAILARRDYCADPEVVRLAAQAAEINASANAQAKKQLYFDISSLLTGRGGQNRMRYCDAQVDNWIIEAERATDRAVKKEIYSKIQKAVAEQLPQIYLWYPSNVVIARKRVGNINVDLSGSWYFIANLTLDEK